MQMLGYDLPGEWTYEQLDELLNPPKPALPAPTPPTAPGAPEASPGENPVEPGETPMAPEMIEAQRNPSPAVLAQREHMRQLGEAGLLSAQARADLKRWRRKVQAHEGKVVPFESDDIPETVQGLLDAGIETLGLDAFNFLKAVDETQQAAETLIEKILKAAFGLHIQDVINAIMAGQKPDLSALKETLLAGLLTRLVAIVTEQAMRTAATVGVTFDPAVINAGAVAWARTYTYELVKGLTETTLDVVRGAIEQFVATPGMTMGEVAKLLEPAFGEARAKMIAMTETTRAFSQSTNAMQELLAKSGIKMTRIWRTQNDEMVCPVCGPLNGKGEIEWADEFPEGPPAHVNCRCVTALMLERP